VARALPKQKYFIESPNDEWRSRILVQGKVILGDVQFIMKPYDFKRFDGGSDLVVLWVNITDLLPHVWKEEEFNRIAMELGGYFIEVDPYSWEHIDINILRIRVGVKSKEVVLLCRNMIFIEDDGFHTYYDILFQVEDESVFHRTCQH
jgi:Domain of unknown function (DUF4283)